MLLAEFESFNLPVWAYMIIALIIVLSRDGVKAVIDLMKGRAETRRQAAQAEVEEHAGWQRVKTESEKARDAAWERANKVLQDQITELQKQNSRQQRLIESLQLQVNNDREIIAQLRDLESQCQATVSGLYDYNEMLHEFAARIADELRKLGGRPGKVPPLPEKKRRLDVRHQAGFMVDTAEQAAQLLQGAADQIKGETRAAPPAEALKKGPESGDTGGIPGIDS